MGSWKLWLNGMRLQTEPCFVLQPDWTLFLFASVSDEYLATKSGSWLV